MYGNLPGLRMCAGDNVVWYTFGLGTEVDMHGVFFEGNIFKRQNNTRDVVNVFPHTTAVATMQPNTPGESSWALQAWFQKHFVARTHRPKCGGVPQDEHLQQIYRSVDRLSHGLVATKSWMWF